MSSKTKTTATKDEPTPELVPKLRFPEFRDTEGWPQMRLIDTADRSVKWSFIGGPFGSNLKSSDYVPDGVRIIQLQNIGDGEFFNEYQIFTTPQKADELLSNNIYPGEIIMSKMGDPVGRACLIPEDHDRYVMCSDGIRLVVDERKNAKYFIYSLINSPLFRAVVEKTATGSTRKRIGLDELKSLPMWLPKKPEQQKIAECLSSVDEVIAAQARKLDALKTHKKALMQQLFPREGETQPRLRFPEFQNAGEWKEQKLEDIAKRGSGHTPNKAKQEYYDGGIKWVSLADSKRLDNGLISETEIVISEQGIKNSSAVLHPAGSVILSRDAGVGKSAVMSESMAVSQHFIVWTCDKDSLSNWFLYYILQIKKPVFESVASGSTIKTIGLPFFKELRIIAPPVPEQQRIATCLSSLDALITAENQKLEALKTHKKGLMQQLFPSPEEVEA
jgi:type I restriction enzyme, S subunit